ncbi:MAG: TIGR00730 family Rossman fold protein [Rhodospirillales bacterium]|nr:TIGR00730 family Rossman fold protein [Rhodospirillales bacterium]
MGTPPLKSICVFCGSSDGTDPRHREAALRLGERMAVAGLTLVYGGGHVGLMGAIAEAALNHGGHVVGIIPDHLVRAEVAFLEISELIVVDSMHSRKRRMFDLADAFCVLPGGLGTLDETFEILTWKQLHLHNKPVVLLNEGGYWNPLLTLVDRVVERNFARPGTRRLFSVVESVDQVIAAAQEEMEAAVGGKSQLF